VVLVALFALPVLRPRGFPGFEGWLGATLDWPARSGVGGPSAAPEETPPLARTSRERELEAINARLREENLASRDEASQRARLGATLPHLARLPRCLPARIVRAHDASILRRSVVIDVGTADGVREGLAVVQGGVLVGIVRQVRAHDARVMLVTDRASRLEVAVRTVEGERAVGYLSGGGDLLPLRHVRARDGVVVRPGDAVVTSNADEYVPAGLVVGRVAAVSGTGGPDAFLDVTVGPLLDLERSTAALVVMPPE
jgi:rod shape-determining protein MreC